MKLFLLLAIFCGTALAEGDMGNGGYTGCTQNCPPPPCQANCRTLPVNDPTIKVSDQVVIFLSRFISRILL
jgi:hypothetical protein